MQTIGSIEKGFDSAVDETLPANRLCDHMKLAAATSRSPKTSNPFMHVWGELGRDRTLCNGSGPWMPSIGHHAETY